MSDFPALFSDLAVILVTAGITTVLFKWLKQPLVLGYIIAGIVIGPYVLWFPVIVDHNSVEIWSEIGMVFLLFAIGLEFNFKKLKKEAGAVGIAALTELVTVFFVGFFLGKLLGWSQMDSVFLGAMLSISSATIVVKAFEDLKMRREKFTDGVIGVLVVEELAAIVMMVILSTLSVSASLDGSDLMFSMLKLVSFLLFWYAGGVFLIPTVLKWSRRFMSEETLTVFAVGLCFFTVWLANKAGFSSALGAFIVGFILADTLEAEIIQKVTTPIKNLFGAVFFVSVGMMVNPSILVQYWWQIMVLTIVVVVVKPMCATVGKLLSGNNLKNAIRAGMCFGQVGEFSFIIAALGLSFGVIDDFMYPIIVSVSIITTFLTPYSIKSSEPVYRWVVRRIPKRWSYFFKNQKKTIREKSGRRHDMRTYVVGQLKRTVLYSTILSALMMLSFAIFAPWKNNIEKAYVDVIFLVITLTLASPFVWALAFRRDLDDDTIKKVKSNKMKYSVMRILHVVHFVVAWFFVVYIIGHFFNPKFWHTLNVNTLNTGSLLMAFGVGLVFMLLLKVLSPVMKWYEHIESRFLDNLNKRQSLQSFMVPEVLQENFVLEKMTLSAKSRYAGKSIRHGDFQNNFNVSVVCIDRADEIIDLPRRDRVLYPTDEVTFLGAEEQLAQLRPQVEVEDEVLVKERPKSDMDIHRFEVAEGSCFDGVSLHDSDLRNRFDTFVIAVERDEEFMLNPESSVVFQKDDIVWFVSSENNAKALVKEAESIPDTMN